MSQIKNFKFRKKLNQQIDYIHAFKGTLSSPERCDLVGIKFGKVCILMFVDFVMSYISNMAHYIINVGNLIK